MMTDQALREHITQCARTDFKYTLETLLDVLLDDYDCGTEPWYSLELALALAILKCPDTQGE